MAVELNKELFAERPDRDPPRSAGRKIQAWRECVACHLWFAAPRAKPRQFCSTKCFGDHAAATGRLKGADNPRWLGGVSNDNMRYRRRQKARHPIEEAARKAVRSALIAGRLVRQPCEVCGAEKAQAHHDDYSKPLDVRWLCRPHHDEHHALERRRARVASNQREEADMSETKIRAAVEALVSALVEAARAPQPDPPAEYLTTAGAAQLASVTPETVRRWVRDQKLRGYRSGRFVRVKRADLEQLLKGDRAALSSMTPEQRAEMDFAS